MIKSTVFQLTYRGWYLVEFDVDGIKYQSHRLYHTERAATRYKNAVLKKQELDSDYIKNLRKLEVRQWKEAKERHITI